MRIVRVCCGLAGIALLLWAGADWQSSSQFHQLALRVKGVVIGAREQNMGGGQTTYFPRVEFMTADGQRHKFSNENGVPAPPRIGDEVSVLYDPAMPERARMDEADDKILIRILTMAAGMCLVLMSALAMKRKAGLPSR